MLLVTITLCYSNKKDLPAYYYNHIKHYVTLIKVRHQLIENMRIALLSQNNHTKMIFSKI